MEPSVLGTWRIVEMDVRDLAAIELVGPALMQLSTDGHGQFGFIAVQGQADWKPDPDSTSGRVAFTWEGDDEGDCVSGRGWASAHKDERTQPLAEAGGGARGVRMRR